MREKVAKITKTKRMGAKNVEQPMIMLSRALVNHTIIYCGKLVCSVLNEFFAYLLNIDLLFALVVCLRKCARTDTLGD